MAAHHDPSGVKGSEFAAAFNQPAFAEVSVAGQEGEAENIEIHLRPAEQSDDCPVLWLGVKNDALDAHAGHRMGDHAPDQHGEGCLYGDGEV